MVEFNWPAAEIALGQNPFVEIAFSQVQTNEMTQKPFCRGHCANLADLTIGKLIATSHVEVELLFSIGRNCGK